MGVDFKLKFYTSSEARAERVAKSVYSRVEELNYIFLIMSQILNSVVLVELLLNSR